MGLVGFRFWNLGVRIVDCCDKVFGVFGFLYFFLFLIVLGLGLIRNREGWRRSRDDFFIGNIFVVVLEGEIWK